MNQNIISKNYNIVVNCGISFVD